MIAIVVSPARGLHRRLLGDAGDRADPAPLGCASSDAKGFKALQLVSAAAVSFGHGANDAQKTIGIMAALLYAGGYIALKPDGNLEIDWSSRSSRDFAIAAGTIWGGWKIIETMGLRITTLRANQGWPPTSAR